MVTWLINCISPLICLIAGHDWKTLRINKAKHIGLVHLHPEAGKDNDCQRCGAQWRDAGHWVSHDYF